MKKTLTLVKTFIITGVLTTPGLVFAQSPILDGLNTAGNSSESFQETDFLLLTATIFRNFLGLSGIAALALVIYAALLYLFSAGNSARVSRANQLLIYAAIGLVIIFGAFSLTNFVITQLAAQALLN